MRLICEWKRGVIFGRTGQLGGGLTTEGLVKNSVKRLEKKKDGVDVQGGGGRGGGVGNG